MGSPVKEVAAMTPAVAGADILIMRHPEAIPSVKGMIEELTQQKRNKGDLCLRKN
jgi:CO dehydrogenase/acetyl-CoA synthase delta subunit